MTTVFKLIIEDDEGKTTVYPLSNGDVSIGRRDGNTIRLMERNVSRKHARLHRKNGEIFIEDLDSYNGIKINGERIAGRYEVKEGDLVEIGDFHLALQRSEVEGSQPPAAAKERPWAGDPKGTVPDWPLPQEIVGEGKKAPERLRDTILDQPLEELQAEPVVKPPPRGEQSTSGDLPSFPSGGLPASRNETAATKSSDGQGGLSIGPAVSAAVPRLVCVSTSYAGKEFALTRPELIIGRVEDNDIVIEHRSVSRNHAKILFDGRTHKIIDLQSANGILVNGEEYAMTDLRKGDLIELGHVRFRFIPAHQSFAPTDEESEQMREAGVEPPPPATSNGVAAGADVPIPSYDPSQAQTVTDTPLDVIGVRETFAPKVEAPRTEAKTEANTERPVKGVDDRPTEINKAPPSDPPAAVTADVKESKPPASGYPRATGVEFEQWEEPASRRLWVGLLGVLAVVAVCLLAFLLTGNNDRHDQEIQKLFDAGKFNEVSQYFNDHSADFSDMKKANSIRLEAEKKTKALIPTPASDLDPEDEVLEPVDSEDVPPTDNIPEDEMVDDEVEDTAQATKKPRKARRRRAPRNNSRRQEAEKRSAEAERLLLGGNLSGAKTQLDRCIALDKRLPSCHRMLGVYYARSSKTEQALFHYERYLKLAPNAPDFKVIEKIVREARGE